MWCPWIVLSNRPWVIKFIIWEIISFVNSSKIIVRNLTFGGLPESRSDIDIKVPKSVAKIKMFNCPNLNKGDWLEFRTDLKITEQWNAVTQLQSFQNCPMSQLHDDYVSEKHILTWIWFAKKLTWFQTTLAKSSSFRRIRNILEWFACRSVKRWRISCVN